MGGGGPPSPAPSSWKTRALLPRRRKPHGRCLVERLSQRRCQVRGTLRGGQWRREKAGLAPACDLGCCQKVTEPPGNRTSRVPARGEVLAGGMEGDWEELEERD